ncbi:GNAT family N-acetyltransferase [Natronosalvus caseinilyticus]|uniref:GNAT family N-acetyltransferase n=1 Tax=Natronosalvus caseinilyticus TaxID=2953747 RepID=UPI0028A71C27|nr:GNAT family protein [Natronosalvus caseinilyticus]
MPGARITSGERITLRTVEREDVPFLQRAFANPEIRYPIGNPLGNQEQVEIPTEDDDSDQFLVCLDDGRPGQPDEDDVERLGVVYVGDAHYRRPELGYWLAPAYHGQGYGSEALSLVVDYVFRVYDHPAVGAGVFDFNDASRGLLESLGFEEEGRIRRDRFIDGAYRDTIQYGLLREVWRER